MPCNYRLYIIANYIANYHTNRCSRRIGHEISHYSVFLVRLYVFTTYWSMGCSLIPQYRSKKPFFLPKRTENTIHTNGLDYTIAITPLLATAWHYYLRGLLNYWIFCKPLRFYSLQWSVAGAGRAIDTNCGRLSVDPELWYLCRRRDIRRLRSYFWGRIKLGHSKISGSVVSEVVSHPLIWAGTSLSIPRIDNPYRHHYKVSYLGPT